MHKNTRDYPAILKRLTTTGSSSVDESDDKPISLAPLSLEDALRGALATGSADEPKKKREKAKRRKKK